MKKKHHKKVAGKGRNTIIVFLVTTSAERLSYTGVV